MMFYSMATQECKALIINRIRQFIFVKLKILFEDTGIKRDLYDP